MCYTQVMDKTHFQQNVLFYGHFPLGTKSIIMAIFFNKIERLKLYTYSRESEHVTRFYFLKRSLRFISRMKMFYNFNGIILNIAW